VSEKPIIFSTPMVQAILAGRKTMTRRVIKSQPPKICALAGRVTDSTNRKIIGHIGWETSAENVNHYAKIPYEVGDTLWVREAWCKYTPEHVIGAEKYAHKANVRDEGERCRQDYIKDGYHYQWKPSIHMPREAARLFLKVKNIRFERLQDITEEDARREGCIDFHDKIGDGKFDDVAEFDLTARDAFIELWDGLNSKRGYGWELNPWVWVVEFETTEVPINV